MGGDLGASRGLGVSLCGSCYPGEIVTIKVFFVNAVLRSVVTLIGVLFFWWEVVEWLV